MVKLTLEMAEKGASHHLMRLPGETRDHYLKKLTHLHLQGRNIDSIVDLSVCWNLTVLYLYDNCLQNIENLDAVSNLTCLYLQRNNIRRITNLYSMKRLRKLYLGHNQISVVEGLEGLCMLEELHLENQKLAGGETLLFEPRSVEAVKGCLQVLNICNNQIECVSDLQPLSQLEHLMAKNNRLHDIADFLLVLAEWPKLQTLHLEGNPMCQNSKYKEKIIVGSEELEELDGKVVTEATRRFLRQMEMNQKGRGIERDQHKNIQSQQLSVGDFSKMPAKGQCKSYPQLGRKKQSVQNSEMALQASVLFPLPAWGHRECNIVEAKSSDLLNSGKGGPVHCIPRPFWRSKSKTDVSTMKCRLQSQLDT